jgi:protein-S-isoprenylcysteine O-methyltransferase Ste14
MSIQTDPSSKRISRFTADSAIVLSFIVALEIVIMISPFAGFFYAVFNPFLLALNQSSVTRWLTAFFLPHMIVPPNEVLVVIRVLGSIFFVMGMLIFVVCAAQVYLGKLLRKGTTTKGLYVFVRHPQYIGLAVAALGLAIMWPRFLTLVLLAVMLLLYYVLARDEERRMTNRFGESYTAYQNRTGMFLPRPVERLLLKNPESKKRPGVVRVAGVFVIICVIIVGAGFILRAYTVHHLPIRVIQGVDVVAITTEDTAIAADLVPAVLEDSLVAANLASLTGEGHRVLAYFIPIDYVMQGMIANTGDEWKLFQQHKTISMITDFVLHPFAHLTGGHAHHMANMQHGQEMYALPAMKRRVIFLEVRGDGQQPVSPFDDFDVNVQRIPLFFVDVHLHTAEILQVKDTPGGSGWGTLPTPRF